MMSLMVSGVLALFALAHPGSPPQPAGATSTASVTIRRQPPTFPRIQTAAAHDLENFHSGSTVLVVLAVLLAALILLLGIPR